MSSSLTIADTSAWIAYLRDERRPVADAVERLRLDDQIAITEAVMMEVLSGARGLAHERLLMAQLASATLIPTGGPARWEEAARIYRVCRQAGATVRNQIDCLIAAVAINEEVPILHADRDFDLIAQRTPLRVARV